MVTSCLLGALRHGLARQTWEAAYEPSVLLCAAFNRGSAGQRCAMSSLAASAVAVPVQQHEDPMLTLTGVLQDDSQRRALTPNAIVEQLDRYIVGQVGQFRLESCSGFW